MNKYNLVNIGNSAQETEAEPNLKRKMIKICLFYILVTIAVGIVIWQLGEFDIISNRSSQQLLAALLFSFFPYQIILIFCAIIYIITNHIKSTKELILIFNFSFLLIPLLFFLYLGLFIQ